MSYYSYIYEGVINEDGDYIDIDFTDKQDGACLRTWFATYDVGTNMFVATLQMCENTDEQMLDVRSATESECEAMWRAIPNETKLRFAMFRK